MKSRLGSCRTAQRAIFSENLACMELLFFCCVLSHFPLHNPSLHKTCNQLSGYSEGTRRLSSNTVTSAHRGRAVERGKPCPTFQCQSGTKRACGGRAGREGPKMGGEVALLVVVGYTDSGAVLKSLLHKTLSRFSSTQFPKEGKLNCK